MRDIYQKTGAPIHAAYALAQLRVWYRKQQQSRSFANNEEEQEPKEAASTVAAVHQWQTIASACLSRWTGCASLPISYSEASWTGLLNFRTCRYEPTVLDLLPLECRAALPDLADYTGDGIQDKSVAALLRQGIPAKLFDSSSNNTTANNINPYWERWPALRGARLFLGLGDGACANIGSKCSTASRIACTVGTSAAARVCLPLPVSSGDESGGSRYDSSLLLTVEPGLFCYRIDRSHVLVGGALTDGGSVVEWASTLLNLPTTSNAFRECLSEVARLLERYYCESNQTSSSLSSQSQVTVAPFLSGERSTGFRSGATLSMIGLTRETTPAVFLKGCLEGVTLRIDAIVQLIRSVIHSSSVGLSAPDGAVGEEPVRIICSGNALEVNDLWRQMIADCSGLAVVLDRETQEGTSRGVVKLVQRALTTADKPTSDGYNYEKEAITASSTALPNEDAKQYWIRAGKAQDSLIDAVSPLYR